MFSTSKILSDSGEFFYRAEQEKYRVDPTSEGLTWEIPLGNQTGSEKRNVTIIALPRSGAEPGLTKTCLKVGCLLSQGCFDEIFIIPPKTGIIMHEKPSEGQIEQTFSKLVDHKEKDKVSEKAAWIKAWKEGDVSTLQKLHCRKEEIDYQRVQFIAQQIKECVEQKKSSLFVVPLNFATDHFSLISYLRREEFPLIQVVSKGPEPSGFSYKIISPEGQTAGHLFGTIHYANEKMLMLNPEMREAVGKANAIYLEVIATGIAADVPMTLPKDLTQGQINKLDNYTKLLFPYLKKKARKMGYPKYQLGSLSRAFKNEGITTRLSLTRHLLEQLQLHHANVVLATGLLHGTVFATSPIGMEWLLTDEARKNKKELFELETNDSSRNKLIQESVNFDMFSEEAMDGLPSSKEEVKPFLAKKLEEFKATVDAWTIGDIDAMKKESMRYRSDPFLHFRILINRNMSMAGKIHEELSNRQAGEMPLFAVGAAHVVGEFSIIDQLKEKGWHFERI